MPAAILRAWGSGPVFAIDRAAKRSGLMPDDADVIEINEAVRGARSSRCCNASHSGRKAERQRRQHRAWSSSRRHWCAARTHRTQGTATPRRQRALVTLVRRRRPGRRALARKDLTHAKHPTRTQRRRRLHPNLRPPELRANIFDRATLQELGDHLDAIATSQPRPRGLILMSAKDSIFIAALISMGSAR
jgi:hypothetical protein